MAPRERAKRGTRTHSYRREILVLFAKMVLLAMVGSQGITEPECTTLESVRSGGGEGHAINYFPHADIKKPEVFYENNTVQQMNSIPFLK